MQHINHCESCIWAPSQVLLPFALAIYTLVALPMHAGPSPMLHSKQNGGDMAQRLHAAANGILQSILRHATIPKAINVAALATLAGSIKFFTAVSLLLNK